MVKKIFERQQRKQHLIKVSVDGMTADEDANERLQARIHR